MNKELSYQAWPEENDYPTDEIAEWQTALKPYGDVLEKMYLKLGIEDTGISAKDGLMPLVSFGTTVRDGWMIQVRYFSETKTFELHAMAQFHRSFTDGEDIVYELYTNYPENTDHTTHLQTWDADSKPEDLENVLFEAYETASAYSIENIPLVWTSRRNAEKEKRRLEELEATRRAIEEYRNRSQSILLDDETPMPNIFNDKVPWEISVTRQWSPETRIYDLRDFPIPDLTKLLLEDQYVIDTALMEMYAHGDHRRAAELARSLGVANPKIEEELRKKMPEDFAYIFFDKPLDEIEHEKPKPKLLN